jgi:hypothetical protein
MPHLWTVKEIILLAVTMNCTFVRLPVLENMLVTKYNQGQNNRINKGADYELAKKDI